MDRQLFPIALLLLLTAASHCLPSEPRNSGMYSPDSQDQFPDSNSPWGGGRRLGGLRPSYQPEYNNNFDSENPSKNVKNPNRPTFSNTNHNGPQVAAFMPGEQKEHVI